MRPQVDELIVPSDTILIGWNGPAPRLRTADEFTSYVETYTTTVGFGFPAVQAEPTTSGAPRISVAVQVRATAGFDYHAVYLQDLDGSFSTGSSLLTISTNATSLGAFAADTWHTFTYDLAAGVDYDRTEVEAALAAGRFAVLSDIDGDDFASDTRVYTSQIDVQLGDSYVRNHQRDDGLGRNAKRNHGATSRQRSRRNHGYR